MSLALQSLIRLPLVASVAVLGFTVHAQEFKTSAECKPGMAVMNRQNAQGTVVAIDGSYCKVRWADGTQTTSFAWMLRPAGAGTNTTDKLVNGTYTCYSGSNYLFMDIRIDGAEAYQDGKGAKGKYQLDPKTQDIRFLSGPYKEAKGKLLPGPRIGMNMTGGSFYSVTCSPKK